MIKVYSYMEVRNKGAYGQGHLLSIQKLPDSFISRTWYGLTQMTLQFGTFSRDEQHPIKHFDICSR